MAKLRVNGDAAYDGGLLAICLVLAVCVAGEALAAGWGVLVDLPVFGGSPRLAVLALLAAFIALLALPFLPGVRSQRWLRSACKAAVAGTLALTGFLALLVMSGMLGLFVALLVRMISCPVLDRAIVAFATLAAFVVAGYWAGWRFGVLGSLWGAAGALVFHAGMSLWLGAGAHCDFMDIGDWPFWCATTVVAAAAGHLGARRFQRALTAPERRAGRFARGIESWLDALAGCSSGVMVVVVFYGFLGFHLYLYPSLRNCLFEGVCHGPVDMCSDGKGNVYVLSCRQVPAHSFLDPSVFVFDSEGHLQASISISSRRLDWELEQIAVTDDGRILVTHGSDVYAVQPDGSLESAFNVGWLFEGDILAVRDHLYVLDRRELRCYDLSGRLLGRHTMPDGFDGSNLARTPQGECAVSVGEEIHYFKLDERRGVPMRAGEWGLGHERLLWHDEDGPVILDGGYRPAPTRGRLLRFGADGKLVAQGAVRFSLGGTVPPFGFRRSAVSVGDEFWALNLSPLYIHVFDRELDLQREINLCGSVFWSEAVKFERVLSMSYFLFGVLGFLMFLMHGLVSAWAGAFVLTLGVFMLLHWAVRRVHGVQKGQGLFQPSGYWGAAYLLPCLAVLRLLIKLSKKQLPCGSEPEELPES